HRSPGFRSWTGLVVCGCLGWFSHPLLFASLLPLLLVYYLSVGAKHRLAWHVALASALTGGLAANAFWLLDWWHYWWIRAPVHGDLAVLAHRTFHTLWAAPLWGDQGDRLAACLLLAAAAVGVAIFNQTNQRAAARLFGLG